METKVTLKELRSALKNSSDGDEIITVKGLEFVPKYLEYLIQYLEHKNVALDEELHFTPKIKK